MASAINEGKITPQTTYNDPGMLSIGGWPIYNYDQRTYGNDITMTEVLEKSINTGAVFAEEKLGHKNFLNYVNNFDVFEKTGIDLAGEFYSENEEFKKGYDVNFATASFGQGIEMTPLQLIRAFSALANGGKEINPYIVEGILNNDDAIDMTPEKNEKRVILPMTSSKITAMLVSVVENGFAKAAQVPGYYIAGKTGTSQISYASLGENKKGYSDETWQTFIGYAPAFDPKFIALVKLDNPAAKTSSYSAVPIFQELGTYILDYLQVPPDY
jgi:cell division protein FtsI/penicillin-binding protein 2